MRTLNISGELPNTSLELTIFLGDVLSADHIIRIAKIEINGRTLDIILYVLNIMNLS